MLSYSMIETEDWRQRLIHTVPSYVNLEFHDSTIRYSPLPSMSRLAIKRVS